MLAQTQIHLQAAQRVGVVTEVVQALFLVAERDLRTQLDKLLNAALVLTPAPIKATFLP